MGSWISVAEEREPKWGGSAPSSSSWPPTPFTLPKDSNPLNLNQEPSVRILGESILIRVTVKSITNVQMESSKRKPVKIDFFGTKTSWSATGLPTFNAPWNLHQGLQQRNKRRSLLYLATRCRKINSQAVNFTARTKEVSMTLQLKTSRSSTMSTSPIP